MMIINILKSNDGFIYLNSLELRSQKIRQDTHIEIEEWLCIEKLEGNSIIVLFLYNK